MGIETKGRSPILMRAGVPITEDMQLRQRELTGDLKPTRPVFIPPIADTTSGISPRTRVTEVDRETTDDE